MPCGRRRKVLTKLASRKTFTEHTRLNYFDPMQKISFLHKCSFLPKGSFVFLCPEPALSVVEWVFQKIHKISVISDRFYLPKNRYLFILIFLARSFFRIQGLGPAEMGIVLKYFEHFGWTS
jgi:hypothetical protein